MKPIRIVVHGGPAAAHIADALHWLNGSQRASNLHHVSKLFGENEVYTEWIEEPADVREVPAAASSDPMLVSFIQNEVNKVFRARVACHGLDLPENVPPGVLAELVKVARATVNGTGYTDAVGYTRDLEAFLEEHFPENPAPVSPDVVGPRLAEPDDDIYQDSPGDVELPDTCCPECMHDCYGEKPDRHCLECGWHENPRKLDDREAEALAKGWTREFIEGNGVDAELWVSPDKKVACYDLPETI